MGNISLNKANRLIFTNIAGMLIITGVLFFGIFQALGLYTRHGEAIALPSLKGLSVEEAAEVLGFSPATIKRSWSLAKSWLKRELETPCES